MDKYESNKKAEIEYNAISKRQVQIKNDFFDSHQIICKNIVNNKNNKNTQKKYIICSDYFHEFYVCKKYHYEQFTDNIIKNIITDINYFSKLFISVIIFLIKL